MGDGLKERMEGRRKVVVSFTLDVELLEALERYKIEHSINSLSPMINQMLIEWIKNEGEYKPI
jgi:hypothetical protein